MDDVLDSVKAEVKNPRKIPRKFIFFIFTTTSLTSGFQNMYSELLGIMWNAQVDEFWLKTKLNFSDKNSKVFS